MKLSALALIFMFLSGCTTRTPYGECVGVLTPPGDIKPNLEYVPSYWNIFLAGLCSETLVVPAVVVLYDLRCPEGIK